MTAQLIDGNALSKQLRAQVAADTAALKAKGLTPGLAVVLVGNNQASQVYVRNKVKACEDAGLHSVLEKYEATMSEADLLARVEALNNDDSIHGILVQLPLPAHIDAQKVIEAISPAKDVDGFHPENFGKMALDMSTFIPATPFGIMLMLEFYNIDTKGKHAVVIGRSNIVGRPMSILLSSNTKYGNSTVTLCHSHTHNLKEICLQADILVAALGKPEFVKLNLLRIPFRLGIDVFTTGEIGTERKEMVPFALSLSIYMCVCFFLY